MTALPPPQSPLAPEERALIDAAIAAGKVQRVPMGVSATAREYVWRGHALVQVEDGMTWAQTVRSEARATYANKQRAERLRQAEAKPVKRKPRGKREPSKPSAAAMAEILPLMEQGMGLSQITAALGRSKSYVGHVMRACKAAGVEYTPPPSSITRSKAEARENRAAIAPLFAAGLKGAEICRRLGLSPNTVSAHVKALRAAHSGQVSSATHDGGPEQRSACSVPPSASMDGDRK